jgi:hypothetical protein
VPSDKVSVLGHLLRRVTMELTFENICLHPSPHPSPHPPGPPRPPQYSGYPALSAKSQNRFAAPPVPNMRLRFRVYTHTHTHTHTHTCIYVCVFMYVCMYVCMYIHTYVCIYIYIHTYIHIYTYIYIHFEGLPIYVPGCESVCRTKKGGTD